MYSWRDVARLVYMKKNMCRHSKWLLHWQDSFTRQGFVDGFNQVSFWRFELNLMAEFQLQTDAAGSLGYGIYFKGSWCAGIWSEDWQQRGITWDLMVLEQWANSVMYFWCDSLALVHITNSLTSCSEHVMPWVWAFTLHALKFYIMVWARHILRLDNSLLDALLHPQIEGFRELAPEANEYPETLPSEIWHIGGMRLNKRWVWH